MMMVHSQHTWKVLDVDKVEDVKVFLNTHHPLAMIQWLDDDTVELTDPSEYIELWLVSKGSGVQI